MQNCQIGCSVARLKEAVLAAMVPVGGIPLHTYTYCFFIPLQCQLIIRTTIYTPLQVNSASMRTAVYGYWRDCHFVFRHSVSKCATCLSYICLWTVLLSNVVEDPHFSSFSSLSLEAISKRLIVFWDLKCNATLHFL